MIAPPRLALLLALALAQAACPSSPTAAPPPVPGSVPVPGPVPVPPAAPGAPGGTITIAPGGGGGLQVQGAPPLHGDPRACAAFQACCAPHQGQMSPEGLACGLAPASSQGDCAAALQTVRGIFTERGIGLPPGCAP